MAKEIMLRIADETEEDVDKGRLETNLTFLGGVDVGDEGVLTSAKVVSQRETHLDEKRYEDEAHYTASAHATNEKGEEMKLRPLGVGTGMVVTMTRDEMVNNHFGTVDDLKKLYLGQKLD